MAIDLARALSRGVLLGDGAMGTQIQAAGFGDSVCPEEWNVSHPQVIENIHRNYIEAGSQIILTNTFGTSGFRIRRGGVDPERAGEFISAACRAARRAAGEKVIVLGDIGPSGEIIEPYGDTPVDRVKEDFGHQARALDDGGVDAIIIETMVDLGEMKLALEAVKENTSLPVITSMSFSEDGKTVYGQGVDVCARELIDLGTDVLAANCMVGIDLYPAIVRSYRQVSDLPIMVQPNAGQPETVGGKVVYRETPESMAAQLEPLVREGAAIIGGCCGTTPATMAAFKQRLEDLGCLGGL